MARNPLYSGEPSVWLSLTLPEQIEAIRKHLCTGPCGSSQSVMEQRARIDVALRRVLVRLQPIKSHEV